MPKLILFIKRTRNDVDFQQLGLCINLFCRGFVLF